MNRAQKVESIEMLSERFGRAPIAIATDYRGLNVAEISELRAKVREAEGEYLVAKITLTKLAIKDTSFDGLGEFFAGPMAIAFGYSDVVAVAKALTDFARPGVGRRGAFVGTVYTFRRIRRVRTDGDWFKGSGKEESGDQIYAYRCLFHGRASGDTAERRTLALDYVADIMWPDALAGLYEFRLASHESAVFQIDGTDVVVQDGSQSFKPLEGRKMITAGRHTLRLAFLQSPAARLGVILQYRRIDGAGWEVFDLRDILSSAADQAQDPFAPGRGVTKATQ